MERTARVVPGELVRIDLHDVGGVEEGEERPLECLQILDLGRDEKVQIPGRSWKALGRHRHRADDYELDVLVHECSKNGLGFLERHDRIQTTMHRVFASSEQLSLEKPSRHQLESSR